MNKMIAILMLLIVLCACDDKGASPMQASAPSTPHTYTVKLELRSVCADSVVVDFAVLEIDSLAGGAMRAKSASTATWRKGNYVATIEF